MVLVALWGVGVCAAFEPGELEGRPFTDTPLHGAGNQGRTLTGSLLTGGETDVLRVTVR